MNTRRHSTAAHLATALLATTLTLGALGCGSSGDARDPAIGSEAAGLARMNLATIGNVTHSLYRLGPASFLIENVDHADQTQTVTADGTQDTLDVPLAPGVYRITLQPGWQLQQSYASAPFTPVKATLTGTNPQQVSVQSLETTKVRFDFGLGQSEIELGIGVDEGDHLPPGYVPDGYDGVIERVAADDARFQITFREGGGACCFATPDEAKRAYPQFDLFVR